MTLNFYETISSFTPSGTGWQNYDIYTNKSVPKGVVAHIVMGHNVDDAPRTLGVRTDGSSLNRYVKLHEAESYGYNESYNLVSMYVLVDASTGYIETYCDNTSGVTFWLMGYFYGGLTYTEKFETLTVSETGWLDNNLYTAYSVPKFSVCDMLMANYDDDDYHTFGVRTDGSSLNRYITLHEAESSSVEYTDCTAIEMLVRSSLADGKIETYTSTTEYFAFYLLGYFSSDFGYVEKFVLNDSKLTTGWSDWEITSSMDECPAPFPEVAICNINTAMEFAGGVRINGGITSRYIFVHESEDGKCNGFTVPTDVDIYDGVYTLDVYLNTNGSTAPIYYYLLGYAKDSIYIGAVTINSSASFDTGSAPDVVWYIDDGNNYPFLWWELQSKEFTKLSSARFRKTVNINVSSNSTFYTTSSLQINSDARFLPDTKIIIYSDSRFKTSNTYNIYSDSRFKRLAESITKTSDSRFKVEKSFTIYSNSVFKTTNIKSTTSDATFIPAVVTNSFTKYSDARFKRAGESASYYSDTKFKYEQSFNKTSDSRFKSTLEFTKLSDAKFKYEQSTTIDSNTRFKRLGEAIQLNGDARFKGTRYLDITSDSKFLSVVATQVNSDARFKATSQIQTNADARFFNTQTYMIYSSASFAGMHSLDIYSDARFSKYGVVINKTSDARFKTTALTSTISDARFLMDGIRRNYSSDVWFVKINEITTNSNARFKRTQSSTIYSDSKFKWEQSTNIISDVRFKNTLETSTNADANFSIILDKFINSDAQFKKFGVVQDVNSDARFRITITNYIESDSIFFGTIQLTPISDVRFLRTEFITSTSDSRFVIANEISTTSDANFLDTYEKTIASDAKFLYNDYIDIYSDARYKDTYITDTVSYVHFRTTSSISKASDARFSSFVGLFVTSDSRFKGTDNISIDSNVRFLRAESIIKVSDAKFGTSVSLQQTSDAKFKAILSVSYLSDVTYKGSNTISINSSAFIQYESVIQEINLDGSILYPHLIGEMNDRVLLNGQYAPIARLSSYINPTIQLDGEMREYIYLLGNIKPIRRKRA